MESNKTRYILVVGLILLAVVSRWLPHPPNFSPVIGIALLAGARFSSRPLALAVPLVALMISDLVLGWHSTVPYVYLGMAFAVYCGWKSLKTTPAVSMKLGLTTTLAAVGFFVLSNLGVWLSQDLYSHDLSGLGACFVAAIPFFPATLVSGLIYSYALFGLLQIAELKVVGKAA